jgi:hypothetical protein
VVASAFFLPNRFNGFPSLLHHSSAPFPFSLAISPRQSFNPLVTRKRAIILAGSVTAIAAGLFLFWKVKLADPPPSPPQRLGDSEISLTLTRVRTGKQAEFLNGTFREQFLDFLLPSNGLNFASHKFRPPNKAVRLAAADDHGLFLEFKLDCPPGLIPTFSRPQGVMTMVYVNPASSQGASNALLAGRTMISGAPVVGKPTPTTNINLTNVPGSLTLDGGNLSLGSRASPTFSTDTSGSLSLPTGRGYAGPSLRTSLQFAERSSEGYQVTRTYYSMPFVPGMPGSGRMLLPATTDLRLVVIGDDGFEYVQPLWPSPFRVSSDCFYVQPELYPRQSRKLTVQIEQRENSGARGRTVATFQTRNQPQPAASWTADKTPIRKSYRGVDCVLGEITIVESTHPRDFANKYEARFPFQFLENNERNSDWVIVSLDGKDAGGNSASFTTLQSMEKDGLLIHTPQILNPNQVWHLKAVFRRKGDLLDRNYDPFEHYPFEFSVQPVNRISKQ